MRLLRLLLLEYLLQHLLGRGRRRYRASRRRPGPYWVAGPGLRPRRRGGVRVTGCCLPIPMAALAALAVAAGALLRPRRHRVDPGRS